MQKITTYRFGSNKLKTPQNYHSMVHSNNNRISNHKLEIEFGRYKTIRREERICKNCDSSKVEDEFHFLFECKKYEVLRNDSQNILKQYFQMDISNDSKKKLLNKIMSLNDPVIIDILSSHISKCFHVRDKSP